MFEITAEECRRHRPGRVVYKRAENPKEDILVRAEKAIRRSARQKSRYADISLDRVKKTWFSEDYPIGIYGARAVREAVSIISKNGFYCCSQAPLKELKAQDLFESYLRIRW